MLVFESQQNMIKKCFTVGMLGKENDHRTWSGTQALGKGLANAQLDNTRELVTQLELLLIHLFHLHHVINTKNESLFSTKGIVNFIFSQG